MDEVKSAEWSELCYPLKDVFDNFSLPLLVMVDEGYMLNETESLASGQLITIQSQEDVTHFKGTGSDGKVINIPIKCPFKIKLVSQQDGTKYKGIRELSIANPRPKYVEVVSKGRKDSTLVKNGDRLKILLSERGPNGPTFLHFRNQRGKHLRMPIDFGGEYCACAESDQEYSLNDLCSKELPLLVKFVDKSKKNTISETVGVIELHECVNETLVFATTKFEGKTYATAFPLTFDIKVRPMANARRNQGQSFDPRSELVDLDSFRDYMAKEKVLGEGGYVCFAPYDAIGKASELPLQEEGAKNLSDSEEIGGLFKINQDSNHYEVPIQRNDSKRKSTGFLSRVKSKLRGSKSENLKLKQSRPEIVIVRENGALSDGGDSGIYEEIPGDTYVSMDIIDGVRRTLGATKSSAPRKRSLTRVRSAASPPPLPENHPLERRHTFSNKLRSSKAVQSRVKLEQGPSTHERDNFRKFYDNMKKSQLELLTSGVESVGEILSTIKLQKYKTKFEENQIDGKLLVDLDEAVFKDMGLTPFEARKLRKYVFGWRPESESCKQKCEFKCDDLEAQNWTEAEVESHLTGLSMHDFVRFCKNNQVNGDLLWDLVVDEEMITGLLKGKNCRLNVVKLKNYITEGWRPKTNKKNSDAASYGAARLKVKSKKSGNEETDKNSKNSTYMSLKFDKTKEPTSTSVYETAISKKVGSRPGSNERQNSVRSSTPNSSASSVVDSPRSVTGAGMTKGGLKKDTAEPKGRNRLQAKVTYPKNSPYGKTASKERGPLDKSPNSQVVRGNTVANAGVKEKTEETSKSPSFITRKERIMGKNEQVVKTNGNSKPQSPDDGEYSENSKSGEQGSTSVAKGASALTKKPNEGSKESLKQTRKRKISWFSRNSSKSSPKKKEDTSGASSKAFSTGGTVKAKTDSDKAKSSKDTKPKTKSSGLKDSKTKTENKPTAKVVTKTQSKVKAKDVDVKKKTLNQDTNPKSPSVRNLKQQYEKQEIQEFVQGVPLRRSGKSSSRTAFKRKDTMPPKKTENEAAAKSSSSSVAQLRKKFDSK